MARKILVVADSQAMVSLIRDALVESGFAVTSAANGEEGLIAVERESPDIVILDVAMPVMGGMEMLRTLRSQPQTQHLPVILLTGKGEYADVLQGWMDGADRYITKPCSMEEIRIAIERMLDVPARR